MIQKSTDSSHDEKCHNQLPWPHLMNVHCAVGLENAACDPTETSDNIVLAVRWPIYACLWFNQ